MESRQEVCAQENADTLSYAFNVSHIVFFIGSGRKDLKCRHNLCFSQLFLVAARWRQVAEAYSTRLPGGSKRVPLHGLEVVSAVCLAVYVDCLRCWPVLEHTQYSVENCQFASHKVVRSQKDEVEANPFPTHHFQAS